MLQVKNLATGEDARVDVADASRVRILDAAEALFARDGFDATRTARITAQAGVGTGLLFYYFPTKIDLLRALLAERLAKAPLCDPADVARRGDVAGSLLRLAQQLDLGGSATLILHTIIFREANTHPEVAAHIRSVRKGLLELTERVLDAASDEKLSSLAASKTRSVSSSSPLRTERMCAATSGCVFASRKIIVCSISVALPPRSSCWARRSNEPATSPRRATSAGSHSGAFARRSASSARRRSILVGK